MKSKEIALGGIMVAATIVILYAAAFIPISKLAIFAVVSAIVPVCIIRGNIKTAISVYAASAIITFFLVPINTWLLYTVVFGGYGIAKYYIERINKRSLEVMLKLIYSNVIIIIVVFLAKLVFNINIINTGNKMFSGILSVNSDLAIILIFWVLSQVAYWLFDYGLTLIITFYYERIHNRIK